MKPEKHFCLSCGNQLDWFSRQWVGVARPVILTCRDCGFETSEGLMGSLKVWSDIDGWILVPEGCLLIASSEEI